jgi:hypothetical protein
MMQIEGDDLIDFLDDVTNAVNIGAQDGMVRAADALHGEIIISFLVSGPGWKKLHPITIMSKILNRAIDPKRILREFDKMLNSIEIRNESTAQIKPLYGNIISVIRKTTIKPEKDSLKVKLGGGLNIKESVKRIREVNGAYLNMMHTYSVGLFKDTAAKDRVRRGILHEYGGWETIDIDKEEQARVKTAGVEEVLTGGIRRKALRGEQEVEKQGREVRKKVTHGRMLKRVLKNANRKRTIRIPERSFLRMPFDRIQSKLLKIIENAINKAIGDVL